MAFFLAPPVKVRLRGGAGRAAHCARRRTRTRRAMMGSRRRRKELPPGGAPGSLFGSSRASCDRTPCGLRRFRGETGVRPRATGAARGPTTARRTGAVSSGEPTCQGHSAGQPINACRTPVGARADQQNSPNAALQLKRNAADSPCTRRECWDKVGLKAKPIEQPWVSPVMKLGTSRPKKGLERPSSSSTRTGRAASSRRRSLL